MYTLVRKRITARLIRILLTAIFLLTINSSTAHAEIASDFASDVRTGLTMTVPNDVQNTVHDITVADYQSSWDEFGTNVLADGSHPSEDIQKELTNDIVNDLRAHVAYDEKDQQYLTLIHSSPEEVITVEGNGGDDLLPENYIDPHPSLEANPDVNPSVLDMPASAVDTTDSSTVYNDAATLEQISPLPDTFVPAEGAWKPDDITVFENVLHTDTPVTIPPEQNVDINPASADTSSSEVPTN